MFQLKITNSNHSLVELMKCLFCLTSAGFWIYSLVSLRNFYVDQLIFIQKWIRYLLAFLFIFNSPFQLFWPEEIILQYISNLSEVIFLSMIMYFWLSINSMSKAKISHSESYLICMLKIILVLAVNLERIIPSLEIKKLGIMGYSIYALCVMAAVTKVCIESSIEKNFRFLCYFSYAAFSSYGYLCYQEHFLPEESQSSYFILAKETVLNVYVYVVSYLYLPVENKSGEQQFNVDQNPDSDDHDEEQEKQHRKQIFGEIYKDIEMDDAHKNPPNLQDKQTEIQKQKIWETIKNSVKEDDEDEEKIDYYRQGLDDDSDDEAEQETKQQNHNTTEKVAEPDNQKTKIRQETQQMGASFAVNQTHYGHKKYLDDALEDNYVNQYGYD